MWQLLSDGLLPGYQRDKLRRKDGIFMFSGLPSLHFSEEVNDSIGAQRHQVSKTVLSALL